MMLTVEKYLEIHNKWSADVLPMSELIVAINEEFYHELQLAYDEGWNDGIDNERNRQLAISGDKK